MVVTNVEQKIFITFGGGWRWEVKVRGSSLIIIVKGLYV